ncbi:uncharacterized protein [Misgurnus anguillicaudatus]|uniref:uncharacterized protein n=1 Tax=Misgurnus anguillicaudatus TaxID=75329 RepID=UPI003CCFAA82
MYAYPVFQRQSATSSRLLMAPSAEAKHLEKLESGRAKSKEEVLAEARAFVSTNGGDPSDQFLVLAHCKLQFGKYQGQRFRWLLENSLGYAVYLVLSSSSEKAHPNPLSENKQLYLQYTSLIREMAEEVEKYKRKQEMQAEAHATGDQGCLMVEFGDFQGRSMKDVYEDQSKQAQALIRYLVKANPNPNTNMAIFKTYASLHLKLHPPVPLHLHLQPPVPLYIHVQPPVPLHLHLQPPVLLYLHLQPPVPLYVHVQPPVSLHLHPQPSKLVYTRVPL